MSAVGLSIKLDIEVDEAKVLIEDYFRAFPKIKGLLEALGYYGKTHGYIRTGNPMRRKRYFPYWRGDVTPRGLMGQIERASKNSPIQGLAADMTKIAMVRLRRRINAANARDIVRPFMQVHDQIDMMCRNDIIDFWKKVHSEEMEIAAEICLGNKLLKTDTQVSEKWQK